MAIAKRSTAPLMAEATAQLPKALQLGDGVQAILDARLAVPLIPGLEATPKESAKAVSAYLGRLAPGESRRTMQKSLEALAKLATTGDLVARELPWHRLRYEETAALRAALIDAEYTPATVNLRLAALRGVLREAWRLELMSSDAYNRASDLENVRGSTLPRGRALPPGEMLALFSRCQKDSTVRGIRDAAVMAMLYGCGMRRAELARARLVDLDLANETLRVHGKGRRERNVAVVEGVRAALERWLTVRGKRQGPLFYATTPHGKLLPRGLAAGTVRHICQRRASQSALQPFSPHDLRRSCATELLDQDVDLATVSQLLGHAKTDTTRKYDHRGDRATRRAATRLHIPSVR